MDRYLLESSLVDGYLLEDGTGVYLIDYPLEQTAFRLYEDGTETGSTAIAAQNTNITRDVTSNSNLQLRTRLQNTTATAGDATDDYQLQYELNDSGTYYNINDGPLSGSPTITDSYPESNYTTSFSLHSLTSTQVAQSFTANGNKLTRMDFYIARNGSPTGNIRAYVYAHSGTFGTSSVATGTALASSATIDISTLSTTISLVTFTFTGQNQVLLSNATKYVAAVEYTGGNGSNSLVYGVDETPAHSGNTAFFSSSSWSALDTMDLIFYVYADTSIPLVTNFNSASLTDGAATTNRLGAGTGSFVAGEISETGLVTDHQITASNFTEYLYSLTLVSSALANSDTLDFRLLRNGVVEIGDVLTPRITASKSSGVTVTPITATLVTATFAPTVAVSDNKSVTPNTATLITTLFAPTVTISDNKSVTPGVASLTTALFAPTVAVQVNTTVTPGTASLITTTFAPSVALSDNKLVTPGTLSLVTTRFAPTVVINNIVTPNTASLITTTFAPTVAVSNNQSVSPGVASLITATFAPGVILGQVVTPGVASLTTTTFAPSVLATANQVVTPGTASLTTTTTFAPTVLATANQVVIPGTASMVISFQAPTVTTGNSQVVSPATASLTTTTFAPSVATTQNQFVTPATASLTLTAFTPTVSLPVSATPGTASLVTSRFAPSVVVSNNQSAIPSTASLITTTFAPTVAVSNNVVVTPETASLTTIRFAPTVTINTIITPLVAEMITTMFAPTVSVDSNVLVTPITAALTITTFAPTVNTSITARKYYIDSDANIFWVINQTLGLVEKI